MQLVVHPKPPARHERPIPVKYAVIVAMTLLFASQLQAEDERANPATEPPFSIQRVPSPLFDDPLWHGAADPTVVWNPTKREWWVYYAQRRTALKNPKGVDWCHGSAIGIAASKDGSKWRYEGICTGDEGLGEPMIHNCSWWAPCVMYDGGQFHLFVACVDGVYTKWTGKRAVKHFTSQDGKTWKYQMTLPLSSDNCIDPCIYRIGDKWLVWYKDERHGSKTYAAESSDLKRWKVIGPVITDVPHEAPLVWRWKGALLDDRRCVGQGAAYLSLGGRHFRLALQQYDSAGSGQTSEGRGPRRPPLRLGARGAPVVFYHVHYAKGRKTVLQAAELEMDSAGKVICDRDKYAAQAAPPVSLESSQVNVLMADRAKRSGMRNVTVWGTPEGRAWVENWQRPENSFQWSVEAPTTGRYEVSVLAEGSAQAEAEIVSEGGRVTFRLPQGWDKLVLPESLPVPKGRSTVTLRLLKPDNAKLKSLELINLAARDDIHRRSERLRASSKWLRDAKYGIMFQWGGWGYPQHGPKKPWPKMIDDFDVDAFARMADDTGAGYVIWSVTWCSYHFPAPIKAIDRIAPGHTSQRDLVGDLADALAKRNIKLLLYYHTGHGENDWWPNNWDPSDTERKEMFVNNLCDVMTEVGQHYGKKISGWFLDDGMLFYPAPFERITKALKAGNRDRLVSYNSWILPRLTEFQDVYMGEGFEGSAATPVGGDGIFPTGPQKGLFAHGMFILDGPDWGINHPETKINQPRFSADGAAGLVQRASARGQTLSFDLLMYEDGSVSPNSLEVMRAVRRAIRGK